MHQYQDSFYSELTSRLADSNSSDRDSGAPLFELHRSTRSLVSHLLLSVGLTLIAGYVLEGLNFGPTRLILYLPAILVALNVLRLILDDLYQFEDQQIRKIDGRLSLRYKIPLVKYRDIRAISVSQSIFGRLLDYGDVSVGTAAESGQEMVLAGVRDPITLAAIIDDLRTRATDRKN